MSAQCIGEPVSWLRLEQYALGESKHGPQIAAHLEGCAACRATFARIAADAAALPPLPAARVRPAARPMSWRRAALGAGGALALAASVVLAVRRPPPPATGERVKGAEIGFTLVRDDDTLFAEAGGRFRDGDRFKALVSCAPGTRARFDVVVYDDDGASFPLEVPSEVACGNAVPLPGAFVLRGSRAAEVCLVWDDAPPDRAALRRRGFDPSRPRAACKRLEGQGASGVDAAR